MATKVSFRPNSSVILIFNPLRPDYGVIERVLTRPNGDSLPRKRRVLGSWLLIEGFSAPPEEIPSVGPRRVFRYLWKIPRLDVGSYLSGGSNRGELPT